MPTVLKAGPYRVYFYSYDCGEPRHVHTDRNNFSAKFWLDPTASLAVNYGYGRKELREIEKLILENMEHLRDEWNSFCGRSADTV